MPAACEGHDVGRGYVSMFLGRGGKSRLELGQCSIVARMLFGSSFTLMLKSLVVSLVRKLL